MHFDVDNSGYITAENLKEAMARGGRQLPDVEIKNMINEVDLNNNGKIMFSEFIEFMHPDVSSKVSNTFLSRTDSLSDLQSVLLTPPKLCFKLSEKLNWTQKPDNGKYSNKNRKTF